MCQVVLPFLIVLTVVNISQPIISKSNFTVYQGSVLPSVGRGSHWPNPCPWIIPEVSFQRFFLQHVLPPACTPGISLKSDFREILLRRNPSRGIPSSAWQDPPCSQACAEGREDKAHFVCCSVCQPSWSDNSSELWCPQVLLLLQTLSNSGTQIFFVLDSAWGKSL